MREYLTNINFYVPLWGTIFEKLAGFRVVFLGLL